MAASYLIVISERSALAWVLTSEQMAFPNYRAREAAALRTGDELFIYTTRGCFHNPTLDRGRVIGSATVVTPAASLDPPVEVAGRMFGLGCRLRLNSLFACREGIELPPLVAQLEAFPNKSGWAARMRRPLVAITPRDARLLRSQLKGASQDPSTVIEGYIAAAVPPTAR